MDVFCNYFVYFQSSVLVFLQSVILSAEQTAGMKGFICYSPAPHASWLPSVCSIRPAATASAKNSLEIADSLQITQNKQIQHGDSIHHHDHPYPPAQTSCWVNRRPSVLIAAITLNGSIL